MSKETNLAIFNRSFMHETIFMNYEVENKKLNEINIQTHKRDPRNKWGAYKQMCCLNLKQGQTVHMLHITFIYIHICSTLNLSDKIFIEDAMHEKKT